MAIALVDGMSEPWQPDQYHDTYREDVLALVKKKVKARQTRTITPPAATAPATPSSNVVDLVALLQQSLGKRPNPALLAQDDGDGDDHSAPAKTAAAAKVKKPAARRKAAA